MNSTPIFDQVCDWLSKTRGIAYENIFDDAADLNPVPIKDPSNLELVCVTIPTDVKAEDEPFDIPEIDYKGWIIDERLGVYEEVDFEDYVRTNADYQTQE